MPEPPPEEAAVSLSREAHRFVWEHGGSVYVWAESFGGGFSTLKAATSPPLRPELELHAEIERDGRPVAIYLEDGLDTVGVTIRLRRFPRTKLVATAGLPD